MALFENNKDNSEKGANISKRIEKDIKKKKEHKIKGRGVTKNPYINNGNREKEKRKIDNNDYNKDKYMDLDQK